MGKLSGGFHKVADLLSRKITLPEGLPEKTKSFLYFNGNIILVITDAGAMYNTNATGRLSEIQMGALDVIKKQLSAKKIKLTDFALDWKSTGGGKSMSIDDKISKMF